MLNRKNVIFGGLAAAAMAAAGVAHHMRSTSPDYIARVVAYEAEESRQLAAVLRKCEATYQAGESRGCSAFVPLDSGRLVLVLGLERSRGGWIAHVSSQPDMVESRSWPWQDFPDRYEGLWRLDVDNAVGPRDVGYARMAAAWARQQPE